MSPLLLDTATCQTIKAGIEPTPLQSQETEACAFTHRSRCQRDFEVKTVD